MEIGVWLEARVGELADENHVKSRVYRDLFDEETSRTAEETETAAFFENYRKQCHILSKEEMAEMRATFGEGTEIVDCISRERIRL